MLPALWHFRAAVWIVVYGGANVVADTTADPLVTMWAVLGGLALLIAATIAPSRHTRPWQRARCWVCAATDRHPNVLLVRPRLPLLRQRHRHRSFLLYVIVVGGLIVAAFAGYVFLGLGAVTWITALAGKYALIIGAAGFVGVDAVHERFRRWCPYGECHGYPITLYRVVAPTHIVGLAVWGTGPLPVHVIVMRREYESPQA